MRDVTTAYHNANKADVRSSDFLIVASDYPLNIANASTGWISKSTIDSSLKMYRCNKVTSESVTDYGYFSFKNYANSCDKQGITFLFEDCYPTEFYIDFYKLDGTKVKTISWNGNSRKIYLTYQNLLANASANSSNLYEIRFRFRKWNKQGVNPVILCATYGQPAIFTKDDLLSLNITLETDPTAQRIPYNSYECTIIDETDAYNPLLKDSKIYNFTQGQKFKFFNFEKGFNDDEIITDNISLFDHEVCPVGTAYFRDAKQQGTTVTFDFIDIVEKYDKITLSDEELMLSSHFTKTNVKMYLEKLFGDNLDTSEIPSELTAITPFYTESKTQILLYMAQLMQKYVYVTTEGVFSFREQSDFSSSNPFCIELAQSYQNPVIEKNYENNGVEVNNYGYSVSQNSELAFSRIEFLYDGEVKAYSDFENTFDENGQQIEDLPLLDFTFLTISYRLNDIYDKNTLSDINNSTVEEIIKNFEADLDKEDGFFVFKLSDGRKMFFSHYFNYCDSFVKWNGTFFEKISAEDKCYDELKAFLAIPILAFNKLQGCTISTTINSIKRHKYDSKNPAVTVNNPAVTDLETATAVRDWMYEQINNSAFSIETDWRGDCSIELGDDVTAEVAITQNGVRDYESKYIGTVVKNVIEYNGALKMQTTLFAPTQEQRN